MSFWLFFRYLRLSPDSRQVLLKQLRLGMSSGLWLSELKTICAPVFLAIFATCLLVNLCPFRKVISKNMPFLLASIASCCVIFPGCARIQTQFSSSCHGCNKKLQCIHHDYVRQIWGFSLIMATTHYFPNPGGKNVI